MKTPPNNLAGYLEQILGEPPSLRDMGPDETERTPLFLRSAYRFTETDLFSRRFIFATNWRSATA